MSDPAPTEPATHADEAARGADQPATPHRSYAPLFLKGCGFSLLAIVLAVGVMIASKGDFAAIGSALFGVVFLLLMLSSSGLTGFWGDDK